MKVAFLIDNLKGGGAERAVKNISEGLCHKDISSYIIKIENQADYDVGRCVKVANMVEKKTPLNMPVALVKMLREIKNISPDIVIATGTKIQVISGFLKKILVDLPLIFNIQVNLVEHYKNRPWIMHLLKYSSSKSDGYIFISKGIYEDCKGILAKNKKTFFIPNPVNLQEIQRLMKEPLERKYHHIFLKKVFINVGRLTKQKDQETLIASFSKLRSDANLLILGSGEKESDLRKLITLYGMQNRIFMIGFQKNPFKFMAKAHAFVLSSLWEGFANVIVEAMACKIPVISTDIKSGPREILAPNTHRSYKTPSMELAKYGILVPPDNPSELAQAMEIIHKNKDLHQAYSEKGLKRATSYDLAKISNIYRKALMDIKESKC